MFGIQIMMVFFEACITIYKCLIVIIKICLDKWREILLKLFHMARGKIPVLECAYFTSSSLLSDCLSKISHCNCTFNFTVVHSTLIILYNFFLPTKLVSQWISCTSKHAKKYLYFLEWQAAIPIFWVFYFLLEKVAVWHEKEHTWKA